MHMLVHVSYVSLTAVTAGRICNARAAISKAVAQCLIHNFDDLACAVLLQCAPSNPPCKQKPACAIVCTGSLITKWHGKFFS